MRETQTRDCSSVQVVEMGNLDLVRFIVTFIVIFVIAMLPQMTIGKIGTQKRMDEVLRKYYSENEIVFQNLHYVEMRTRVKLSNGVVLSDLDRQYIHGQSLLHLSLMSLLMGFLLEYFCGMKNLKFIYWFWNTYNSVSLKSKYPNQQIQIKSTNGSLY